MVPDRISRRTVLAALGGGAAGAGSGIAARAAPPRDWLLVDGRRLVSVDAGRAMLVITERLRPDAVVVDGAALAPEAFAGLLGWLAPLARQGGLGLHAHFGWVEPGGPPAGPASVDGQPGFARAAHHRYSDPAAAALQGRLRSLLSAPGLTGVQFTSAVGDPPLAARERLASLVWDYVAAPARLQGLVVTAQIADGRPAPRAWGLDGAFLRLGSPAEGVRAPAYARLRQAPTA